MKINLEKELSELADLFEYGHLLAEADPRCFINTVVAEIKQLRKSPWIKVSDQEPPKDGSWFVTRDEYNQPGIFDYLTEGHTWRDTEGKQYPEDSPPFILWVYLPKTENLPE